MEPQTERRLVTQTKKSKSPILVESRRETVPETWVADLELERAVLGVALDCNEYLREGLEDLSTEDFASDRHRMLFQVFLRLNEANTPFDLISLIAELKRMGVLEQVGGATYLSDLNRQVVKDATLARQHVRKLRELSMRRQLLQLGRTLSREATDWTTDLSEVITKAASRTSLLHAGFDVEGNLLPGPSFTRSTGLQLVKASDVQNREMEWCICPVVPRGHLTVLAGDPGCGKTWVACSLASDVSRGSQPFSRYPSRAEKVIFISNEDDAPSLKRRLEKVGANLESVFLLKTEEGQGFSLGQIGQLEAAIKTHQPGLIVIDTLMSHFGAKSDSHKGNEVAALLTPVAAIAQKHGVAILGLMHLNKNVGNNAIYRLNGSIAFVGAARSVLMVATDPEDEDGRILVQAKNNYGANAQSQRFKISDVGIEWTGPTSIGGSDLFGGETPRLLPKADAARQYLRETLSGGPMAAIEIEQGAAHSGISKRTLNRAKEKLGVISDKRGTGGWWWRLPS